MGIDKSKMDAEATSRLCNVMVNCQELVEDLEWLEEMGLFKQQLKSQVKRTGQLCMKQVDNVFGVEHRKVRKAIKAGKSKEEVDKIRQDAKLSNSGMLEIYDMASQSRWEYHRLDFNERLLVNRILKDIKNGNVKYLGSELYYKIESTEELNRLNDDNSD